MAADARLAGAAGRLAWATGAGASGVKLSAIAVAMDAVHRGSREEEGTQQDSV